MKTIKSVKKKCTSTLDKTGGQWKRTRETFTETTTTTISDETVVKRMSDERVLLKTSAESGGGAN